MSKINRLPKSEESYKFLDELIEKVIYINPNLEIHKLSKNIENVLIENYEILPYTEHTTYIFKRIKELVKERNILNVKNEKIKKHFSKKDLNKIALYIIHYFLYKFQETDFMNSELTNLIQYTATTLFEDRLMKDDLRYCKNQVRLIFADVMSVLKKY